MRCLFEGKNTEKALPIFEWKLSLREFVQKESKLKMDGTNKHIASAEPPHFFYFWLIVADRYIYICCIYIFQSPHVTHARDLS